MAKYSTLFKNGTKPRTVFGFVTCANHISFLPKKIDGRKLSTQIIILCFNTFVVDHNMIQFNIYEALNRKNICYFGLCWVPTLEFNFPNIMNKQLDGTFSSQTHEIWRLHDLKRTLKTSQCWVEDD